MTNDDQSQEFAIRYIHDDEDLRREFDHQLALFLRGQRAHDRWNITPLVDTLDRLGQQIPSVHVRLRHRPAQMELQVSLEFGLPPVPDATRTRPSTS
ncbi:hypothetical protein [Streptosporangium sp. NPDC000396]|uniref:hypothetical protein n=1 Tax=Streptosporangium sp. NPDC000396 TaxID=3366185 RepID=UPI0036986A37